MKIVYGLLLVAGLAAVFICTGSRQIKKDGSAMVIPLLTIKHTDTALHWVNGVYYYKQRFFSGIIKDEYTNNSNRHETSCLEGKEEGWTYLYYPNGRLAEKRYYHKGEKDSVHTGWWQNGKLRFEYHFTDGIYNGDYKEWYNSGQAYKHIHYLNGTDEWGKGWRENGRLFMNYTMRQGRRYGIVNSNLCYTIKNEKGDFTGAGDTSTRTVNSDSKPR